MCARNASVRSATLQGIEAVPVTVTCRIEPGRPRFALLGAPGAAASEAVALIRMAVKAAGYEMPRESVYVYVEPRIDFGSTTQLELPMALAVLQASGQIKPLPNDALAVGRLTINGAVLTPREMAAYADLAERVGCKLLSGPAALEDARERGYDTTYEPPVWQDEQGLEFASIGGNELAKRAVAVAVAGGLPILMSGDGDVAVRLARRMTAIMGEPDPSERKRIQTIQSCAAEGIGAAGEQSHRPFRAPHHSCSAPAMIGGGRPVVPGEVSLAHGGVLCLDEIREFSPSLLKMVSIAEQDKCVRISRAGETYAFPSDFQLVAIDEKNDAPLPSSIDHMLPIKVACKHELERTQSTEELRALVETARQVQDIRKALPSAMTCEPAARELMTKLEQSGYPDYLPRVTRAVADVNGVTCARVDDVEEALRYLIGGIVPTHRHATVDPKPLIDAARSRRTNDPEEERVIPQPVAEKSDLSRHLRP